MVRNIQRIMLLSVVAGLTTFLLSGSRAVAQDDNARRVEVSDMDEAPPSEKEREVQTGRKAAAKYMGPRRAPAAELSSASNSDHYLALHLGSYVSDNAYRWGVKNDESNVGKWTLGVTYRVGEWHNSMDLNVRVDLSTYNLTEGQATKLSFLPLIIFPDASSKFPLYFGIGAGPGVYLKQVGNASVLSLDYQLIAGIRFFNVLQSTGFFVEGGIKNAVHLLGHGQYNGTFVALGTVFSF